MSPDVDRNVPPEAGQPGIGDREVMLRHRVAHDGERGWTPLFLTGRAHLCDKDADSPSGLPRAPLAGGSEVPLATSTLQTGTDEGR